MRKKICFLQEPRTSVAWVLHQLLHERAAKEGESRLEVTEISVEQTHHKNTGLFVMNDMRTTKT